MNQVAVGEGGEAANNISGLFSLNERSTFCIGGAYNRS